MTTAAVPTVRTTARTSAGTSAGTSADATTLLTVYLCLLWFIPSPMVVPALGSAGSPANMLGIACFFWWTWYVVRGVGSDIPNEARPQPVRTAMLAWLLVMLVVYAHAMAGPLPGDEISVADSGLLRLIGMAGIVLLACDGIGSTERAVVLVRRLALAAGIVALLGLVQYFTGELVVDRLRIPGLAPGTAGWSLGTRSGFVRPSGTSTSPIEYGVILGMALPLLITCASVQSSRRWLYRLMLVAAIVSIFFSMSRSAYLCSLAGVLVMSVFWPARRRLVAGGFLLAVTSVMYVSVPGLLGAIQGLFSNADEDPSIASRTGSYDIAEQFISSSPIVGRGFGTFLPKYWILDNGYLGLMIEGGVLGLAGLLVLIGSGMASARRASKELPDPDHVQLAQALLASIAAGAAGLAFFDAFAFPQTAACFLLLIGIAGAMRRLARADLTAREAVAAVHQAPRPRPRRAAPLRDEV